MTREFRVISNTGEDPEHTYQVVLPEDKLRHFRNVTGSVLQDALDTWGELWDEMQGTVTHGYLVTPPAAKGFQPQCGWPEFLEKMWLLKHYLDYAKRFCEGK
ncbi:MAG: hypothetical protein A2V67_03400 [Deltaproteobacteria bacterium RBG_13_61_14]|nr:MAG: hypothetical protein A2V67_03400 [Deltaproteobacteria bacterium RBG_13_61_14]